MRKIVLSVLGMALFAIACAWADDAAEPAVPSIHAPFAQEWRTAFTSAQGLPSDKITAIALLDGVPWAATPAGLARWTGEAWGGAPSPEFAVQFLTAHGGMLYAADAQHLAVWEGAAWRPVPGLPHGTEITSVAPGDGGVVLVGTQDGAIWLKGGTARKIAGLPEGPVTAVAVQGQQAAVGMADGLFLADAKDGMKAVPQYPDDKQYSWAPKTVTALAYDAAGRLWFGSRQGIGCFDGADWRLFTGKEGLPYDHFTCAAPGEAGVIWFGTTWGAIRYDGERFAYRASLRWLPNDHVNGIAVAQDGTAWFATPGGVSRIERKTMSLADKATYFEDQVETRHNRMGFVTDCTLTRQGDVTSWQPKITDNDGMYTAMYGAGEAFRYGATHDPEAKARAKRSFDACKWLVDITGIPGFPARCIVPIDWPEDVNAEYGAEYNARKKKRDPLWKDILPRWSKSADGKYLWKCDTSSDELAGHYFFYGVYYDLVAETEAEKAPVREVVAAITDHLIRNGFLLRDHDGKPTRWGNFSPEFLNSVGGAGDRGLNCLMMLSFLDVAEHITGDPKYAKTAKMLCDRYHYDMNAMTSRSLFPPGDVAPWDNNLALLSYYGLIRYEPDLQQVVKYRMALEKAWLFVSKQKNPLWNAIHAALAQETAQQAAEGRFAKAFPNVPSLGAALSGRLTRFDAATADTVDTLQGMPLELMGWDMKNSQRLDVQRDPAPGDEEEGLGWSVVTGKALPIEERSHVRQDRSGFVLDNAEGSGWTEHEGTFYLLPYYMALYHGMLAP